MTTALPLRNGSWWQDGAAPRRLRLALHCAGLALAAVLAALAIRQFLVQPFSIPSGSMSPTLIAGDFILVAKNLPAGQWVGRGDVIVFHGRDGMAYVKRVIAVGGDNVALEGGQVRLNDRLLPCLPVEARLCREVLPDGRSYLVADEAAGSWGDMAPLSVPEGHLFVLGDNRGRSIDSRIPSEQGGLGLVAEQQLIGRASRIFLSVEDGIRWNRIGQVIG